MNGKTYTSEANKLLDADETFTLKVYYAPIIHTLSYGVGSGTCALVIVVTAPFVTWLGV